MHTDQVSFWIVHCVSNGQRTDIIGTVWSTSSFDIYIITKKNYPKIKEQETVIFYMVLCCINTHIKLNIVLYLKLYFRFHLYEN